VRTSGGGRMAGSGCSLQIVFREVKMTRHFGFVALVFVGALVCSFGMLRSETAPKQGWCEPGTQTADSGSIECNSGNGSCGGPIIRYEPISTCHEDAESMSTCRFRKARKWETPAVKTELGSFGTYVYCLGGSALCATCFGVAYAAEAATGAIAGLLAGGQPQKPVRLRLL